MLDVSNNRLTRVEGLETLSQLQDLWLNDNQVTQIEQCILNNCYAAAAMLAGEDLHPIAMLYIKRWM